MIKIMIISTFVLCLLVGVESLMFKGQSCKVDGEEGKCIDIYNCHLIIQEVTQAQNITEAENNVLRKLRKLTCGFSGNTPLICCTPAMQFGNSKTTASLIIDPFDQGLYVPDPDNIIRKPPADIANHINFPLLPRDCGKMDINKKAINEMSWTVLLSYQDNGVKRYLCTGTLINEWYVLTAAHCVVNLGSLKLETLVLGEYDLTQDPDCKLIDYRMTCALLKREIIPAEIISHFGYSPKSLQDDIALIRLKEPAIFSDSIQPICLPTTRELLKERMEGRVGMTAGWGTTEDALQTPTMTSAEIAIKSNQDCQRVIGSNIVIHDSQFCAGGGDSRQCVGDSGGPLFYFRSIGSPTPQYIQHGIVSFGFRRCTDIATPGVFTRVASYMEWILNNIRR